MLGLRRANPVMEKLNLRCSFRNISGGRECKRWIKKVVDREDIDRSWIILR